MTIIIMHDIQYRVSIAIYSDIGRSITFFRGGRGIQDRCDGHGNRTKITIFFG